MSLDLSAAIEAAAREVSKQARQHPGDRLLHDVIPFEAADAAVRAAAPFVEAAVRKEQASRIAALEAIVAEIGKYGEDMLTVADPNVRLIGTALIKAASVARGTR